MLLLCWYGAWVQAAWSPCGSNLLTMHITRHGEETGLAGHVFVAVQRSESSIMQLPHVVDMSFGAC